MHDTKCAEGWRGDSAVRNPRVLTMDEGGSSAHRDVDTIRTVRVVAANGKAALGRRCLVLLARIRQ